MATLELNNEFNTFLAESAQEEWSKLVGEELECESIRCHIYAYGSEVACRKLYTIFQGIACRVDYSLNLQTWYFVKD